MNGLGEISGTGEAFADEKGPPPPPTSSSFVTIGSKAQPALPPGSTPGQRQMAFSGAPISHHDRKKLLKEVLGVWTNQPYNSDTNNTNVATNIPSVVCRRWFEKWRVYSDNEDVSKDDQLSPGEVTTQHLKSESGQLGLEARENRDYVIVPLRFVVQAVQKFNNGAEIGARDRPIMGKVLENGDIEWRPYLVNFVKTCGLQRSDDAYVPCPLKQVLMLPPSMTLGTLYSRLNNAMQRDDSDDDFTFSMAPLNFRVFVRKAVKKCIPQYNQEQQYCGPDPDNEEASWTFVPLTEMKREKDPESGEFRKKNVPSTKTFQHFVDSQLRHLDLRTKQSRSPCAQLDLLVEYWPSWDSDFYKSTPPLVGHIVMCTPEGSTEYMMARVEKWRKSGWKQEVHVHYLGEKRLYDHWKDPSKTMSILPVSNSDWRANLKIASEFAYGKNKFRRAKVFGFHRAKIDPESFKDGLMVTLYGTFVDFKVFDEGGSGWNGNAQVACLYSDKIRPLNEMASKQGSPSSSAQVRSDAEMAERLETSDILANIASGSLSDDHMLVSPPGLSPQGRPAAQHGQSSTSTMLDYELGAGADQYDQIVATREVPGRCGLENLGNTCFMNSMLQCMGNTTIFTEYFLRNKHCNDINTENVLGSQGRLARTYAALIQQMWSGQNASVSPYDMKGIIGEISPQFQGYRQHDAQELLNFLLDGLHEDLNIVKKKPYVEDKDPEPHTPDEIVAAGAWSNFLLRNRSFVVDKFYGQLRSHLTCNKCGFDTVKFDPFLSLSLPIPPPSHITIDNVYVSAGDCKNTISLYSVKVPQKTATVQDLQEIVAKRLSEFGSSFGRRLKFGPVSSSQLEPFEWYKGGLYRKYNGNEDLMDLKSKGEFILFMLRGQEGRAGILRLLAQEGNLTESEVHRLVGRTPLHNFSPQSVLREDPNVGDAIAQRLDHLVYKFVKKVQIVHRYKKSQGNGYYSASMSSVKQKNTWLFRVRSNATLGEIEQYAVNHVQGISWGDAFEERTEKKDTRVRQRSEDGNSEPGALSSSSRKVARTSEMQTSPTAPFPKIPPRKPFTMGFGMNASFNQLQTANADAFDDENRPTRLQDYLDSAQNYSGYSNRKVSDFVIYVDWANEDDFESRMDSDSEGIVHMNGLEAKMTGMSHSPTSGRKKKVGLTLEKCFSVFSEKEQLGESDEWYCPSCKEHVRAHKKMDVWKAPDVLIVHLKRFEYAASKQNPYSPNRKKLDRPVHFPAGDDVLELDEFVKGPNEEGKSLRYKLFAVSEHSGDLGYGHYTASCLNHRNNVWYKFNDSWVSNMRGPEEINRRTAYVLFYERVEEEETLNPEVDGAGVEEECAGVEELQNGSVLGVKEEMLDKDQRKKSEEKVDLTQQPPQQTPRIIVNGEGQEVSSV